jgi:hypothetical protein
MNMSDAETGNVSPFDPRPRSVHDGSGTAPRDDLAQTSETAASAAPHPEEMKASVDLRIGEAVSLKATVRTTPAGLVTTGIMVAAVVLSVAALVWAVRRPSA